MLKKKEEHPQTWILQYKEYAVLIENVTKSVAEKMTDENESKPLAVHHVSSVDLVECSTKQGEMRVMYRMRSIER